MIQSMMSFNRSYRTYMQSKYNKTGKYNFRVLLSYYFLWPVASNIFISESIIYYFIN